MSMIDEQIRDGDFVVVNDRGRADNGETVIALIDGTSATVKKYYRERDGDPAQPANATMEPIYVNENDIRSRVVVGVLRRTSGPQPSSAVIPLSPPARSTRTRPLHRGLWCRRRRWRRPR